MAGILRQWSQWHLCWYFCVKRLFTPLLEDQKKNVVQREDTRSIQKTKDTKKLPKIQMIKKLQHSEEEAAETLTM